MNCPSEFTWSVYVDDELPHDELRGAEMHLVSCRACRHRVMALRDEIDALSNVFYERAFGRASGQALSRPQKPPPKDLSWSLPMAIAAVTAVLTIAGLLIELRLPGVLDLLNPKRLIGVNEMAFDAIFMLRGRWPELSYAVASVGAMAAFSALGCAALHALSRHIAKASSLSLLLILLMATPEIASALDFRSDVDTHIGAGETVSEMLVCTGEIVRVDGTIDGDLIVGAERFTLRGTVTGNLYVFASEVEIDGIVQGTVVGMGERVSLSGRVDGAVTLAGDRVTIMDGAQLGRDVAVFGEGVRIAGRAARDVTFAGDWIEVGGEIARDLHILGADRVVLLDSARVGGDVRARLMGRRAEIEQAPESIVSGEVTVSKDSLIHDHYLAHYKETSFYLIVLIAAAGVFVFGLLIYLLDPRLFEADPPDARGFVRSLGIGFVVLLSSPVAIALIGLTIVGIPVAVLGLFFLISAVYTSYVLVAGLVGQAVLTPSGPGIGSFAPSLLVGVLILSTIAALPFVGPAVRILAVLFGLGCLFERARGLHALNLRGIRG
jgi:cytoskeletal protein CcmA (bactofilin family)